MSLAAVVQALRDVTGVTDVHHVHAWALTSGRSVFSGHVGVAEAADAESVLASAHRILKERFGFFFETLQVESGCVDEPGAEAIDVTRRADEGPA